MNMNVNTPKSNSHNKCSECGNTESHTVFCIFADVKAIRNFLRKEMLTSIKKHWESERRFNAITEEYMNLDTSQVMSQTDREYQAAKDPRRKAAADNAKYHINRAMMYATVLNSLS